MYLHPSYMEHSHNRIFVLVFLVSSTFQGTYSDVFHHNFTDTLYSARVNNRNQNDVSQDYWKWPIVFHFIQVILAFELDAHTLW